MSMDKLLAELVEAEGRLVGAALGEGDPVSAWLSASARHEQIVLAVASAVPEKAACSKGCWFCCHFRVSASAYEVLALAAWVERNLGAERQAEIRNTARQNAASLRALDPVARLRKNLPCPVLHEGACGAYAARPSRCRSYHATDVEGCKDAYARPDEPGAGHTLIPPVHVVARTLAAGFREAIVAESFDDRLYELSSALTEALAGDAALRRYLRGERAFVDAIVFTEPGPVT